MSNDAGKPYMILTKTINMREMIDTMSIDMFRSEICSKCEMFVDCSLEDPQFGSASVNGSGNSKSVFCCKKKHRLSITFSNRDT